MLVYNTPITSLAIIRPPGVDVWKMKQNPSNSRNYPAAKIKYHDKLT